MKKRFLACIISPENGHELVITHFTFKYSQPRGYFLVLID